MTNRTALDAYMDVAIARSEGRDSITIGLASDGAYDSFLRMLRRNGFNYSKDGTQIEVIINHN